MDTCACGQDAIMLYSGVWMCTSCWLTARREDEDRANTALADAIVEALTHIREVQDDPQTNR